MMERPQRVHKVALATFFECKEMGRSPFDKVARVTLSTV